MWLSWTNAKYNNGVNYLPVAVDVLSTFSRVNPSKLKLRQIQKHQEKVYEGNDDDEQSNEKQEDMDKSVVQKKGGSG